MGTGSMSGKLSLWSSGKVKLHPRVANLGVGLKLKQVRKPSRLGLWSMAFLRVRLCVD
jgi:hypothetical protein